MRYASRSGPVGALTFLLGILAGALDATAAQDTVVVRADDPPLWGPEVRVLEDLRIGTLEGAEEEMFGRIGGVAVWDPRNVRVSVYDSEGVFVTSHTVPAGLYAAEVFQVDHTGVFHVRTSTAPPQTPWEHGGYGWIRVSAEGEILDTVPVPPQDQVGGGFVLATPQGYMHPFPVETMSTMSPHGYLITARNDEYAFTRPLPDGRVLKVVRDFEPLPLARQERGQWEALVRRFEELARDQGRPADFGPIPSRKPPFHRIWADDEGRVWVSRYAEAEYHPLSEGDRAARGDRPVLEWRQNPVFDVFHPDGAYVGQVTLPRNTRIVAARGDRLWVVATGEFGEAYVVRYRLDRGDT